MAGAVLSYQKTMIIRITAVSTAILRKNPLTMIDKIVKALIRQKIAELQPRQIEAGLYFQASQESRNRKTVILPRQMSLKSKRYKGQRLKILLSKNKKMKFLKNQGHHFLTHKDKNLIIRLKPAPHLNLQLKQT